MSDVSEHSDSEFYFPKKKKIIKNNNNKKEKRGGHMIKCLLTELGRAGRENIWPSVMTHGPRCARSVRHELGPNIFPSGPPTQSISTYYGPKVVLHGLTMLFHYDIGTRVHSRQRKRKCKSTKTEDKTNYHSSW